MPTTHRSVPDEVFPVGRVDLQALQRGLQSVLVAPDLATLSTRAPDDFSVEESLRQPLFVHPHEAEVVAGGDEEVNAPLHVHFRGSVENSIIGEEKFVNGSYGHTRLKVHPPLIEELAIYPTSDADPGAFVTLADSEAHVGGFTMTAEVALAFRHQTLFQVAVETVEKDASKDLSGDVEQRDSSVVVAELTIPFPLYEWKNVAWKS
nr:unnamed protein product [Spirometra erinaceieuropaei]